MTFDLDFVLRGKEGGDLLQPDAAGLWCDMGYYVE